jgi:HSP20 family protein
MLVRLQGRRPRADVGNFEQHVDRILRSFFAEPGVSPGSASGLFEVTADKDGITVRAELPGVEPSAINIAVNDRALTISGERSAEQRSTGTYRLRERTYGHFARTFYLSDDLDAGAVDAQCRNGVLTVRIPKRPEAKPRQIEVKTA